MVKILNKANLENLIIKTKRTSRKTVNRKQREGEKS